MSRDLGIGQKLVLGLGAMGLATGMTGCPKKTPTSTKANPPVKTATAKTATANPDGDLPQLPRAKGAPTLNEIPRKIAKAKAGSKPPRKLKRVLAFRDKVRLYKMSMQQVGIMAQMRRPMGSFVDSRAVNVESFLRQALDYAESIKDDRGPQTQMKDAMLRDWVSSVNRYSRLLGRTRASNLIQGFKVKFPGTIKERRVFNPFGGR